MKKSFLFLMLAAMVAFVLACTPKEQPKPDSSKDATETPSQEPSANPSDEPSDEPSVNPTESEDPSVEPEDPSVEPEAITIDGEFEDWADIEGVSGSNLGAFKATSDANNLYFYCHRTTGGRYSAIWSGEGYVYVGFELDNDPSNNTAKLWAANSYDLLILVKPYGGTSESPSFKAAPGDGIAPDGCSVSNIKCAGVTDEEGAKFEFSIPRADLVNIPASEIVITAWGNKDLCSEGEVSLHCTL